LNFQTSNTHPAFGAQEAGGKLRKKQHG